MRAPVRAGHEASVATAGSVVAQVVVRRDKSLYINDGVFGTLAGASASEGAPAGARHPAGSPDQPDAAASSRSSGRHATPTTFWVRRSCCRRTSREGDWIEVGMMGAYSLSMRTRFNGFYTNAVVRDRLIAGR